jgi:hypothetical protein
MVQAGAGVNGVVSKRLPHRKSTPARARAWAFSIDVGTDAAGNAARCGAGDSPQSARAPRAMNAEIGQGQAGSYLEPSALTVGAFLADQCLPGPTKVWSSTVRVYRGHLAPGTARGIDLNRPYVEQPTAALPRLLIVRALCAARQAQSSVARGTRLTPASCFHTLVSAIDGVVGLPGGTVRVARRTAAENQVRGRGPGCSGRRAGC